MFLVVFILFVVSACIIIGCLEPSRTERRAWRQ